MRSIFNVKALSLKGLLKRFVASVLSASLFIGVTCSFVSPQDGKIKTDAVSGATSKKEYKKADNKVVSAKKDSTTVKKKQVVKKASAKGTKKPSVPPAKA